MITDGQITASSEAGAKLAPSNARLHLKTQKTPRKRDGGWSAKKSDVNQWLQIDLFDENAKVTGVATQGREDNNQWVLEYKLQFSDDGVDFQDYMEPGQTEGKVSRSNIKQTWRPEAANILLYVESLMKSKSLGNDNLIIWFYQLS